MPNLKWQSGDALVLAGTFPICGHYRELAVLSPQTIL
jgi:hypothetical protein